MKKNRITVEKNDQQPLLSFPRVIRKAANAALAAAGADLPCAVDVSLVGEEEIRRINRENREIDKVTDVLSFPQLELTPGKPLSEAVDPYDLIGGRVLLGDVVLCYPVALKQAVEYGHAYQRELAFLTVHSVLHLLGYDHETPEEESVMFSLTEEILTSLGLGREEKKA
ncbi:MAG: rRNA maturation RNase YbeY [Clostridia bacterium]|nr:rRNA maturation RNase YbeY [Clostridia bacterium]